MQGKVSLLLNLEDTASVISNKNVKFVLVWPYGSSSSSSPLLSLVQVPAKLAINLSIHTQHTYDNGVDRTGDRVFRKYSFLHEEREAEKNFFNPQTMLHLEYSLRTEKKTPQHKSTYTINTWHCNRGKHIQLWQAAIRSSAMRRRSQTCSP